MFVCERCVCMCMHMCVCACVVCVCSCVCSCIVCVCYSCTFKNSSRVLVIPYESTPSPRVSPQFGRFLQETRLPSHPLHPHLFPFLFLLPLELPFLFFRVYKCPLFCRLYLPCCNMAPGDSDLLYLCVHGISSHRGVTFRYATLLLPDLYW